MTFTTYGQPVEEGFCPVHPDVASDWPCGVCERCENEAWEHAEALSEIDRDEP
jgi:hypothetical protein